eukprot:353681-Chlamydomonas_euryale.AAC.3
MPRLWRHTGAERAAAQSERDPVALAAHARRIGGHGCCISRVECAPEPRAIGRRVARPQRR